MCVHVVIILLSYVAYGTNFIYQFVSNQLCALEKHALIYMKLTLKKCIWEKNPKNPL